MQIYRTAGNQRRHCWQRRGTAWVQVGRTMMFAVTALVPVTLAFAAAPGALEDRQGSVHEVQDNRQVVAQSTMSFQECWIANIAGAGPPECQEMLNRPLPAPLPKDATPEQALAWYRQRYADMTCDRDKTELCFGFAARISELEGQIERDRQAAEAKRQDELAALAAREQQIQEEAARLEREKAAAAAAEARRIEELAAEERQRSLILYGLGALVTFAAVSFLLLRAGRRSAAAGGGTLPIGEMAKAFYWLTRTGIIVLVAMALWSTSGEILRVAFALLPGWARQPLVEALDAAKEKIEHMEASP